MTLSDAMTSQIRVKSEPLDNGYEQANDALNEEKFKKFKVPDKVKQLFINKTQSQTPNAYLYITSPSGAAARGVNVVETSKWTPPATSTQYIVLDCPVSQPGVSTSSTKTVVSPNPLTSGGSMRFKLETNPLSSTPPILTLTKVTTAKSNQTVTSLLQTTTASKPPVSTASNIITTTLNNNQQYQPPAPPVSVILPRPNMRPQVMFIPVTTTGKIASGGVFPAPVHARFPVTTRSLIPASVNGQCGSSGVIRKASPVNKVTPPPQQKNVAVLYPVHRLCSHVQAVASNRVSPLLSTSMEPKKVFAPVPTTHTTNVAGVKTVSGTGSTGTVTAHPAAPNSNAKFYLLKVDGKNILIPMATDRSPPMAYVMNGTASPKTTASTSMTSPISSIATGATLSSATTITVSSVGANNRLVVQSVATSNVVNSQGTSQTTLTQKAQTLKTTQSALRYTSVASTKPRQNMTSIVPIYDKPIVVQLQTLSTIPLNKDLKYAVSQKTSIGDALMNFAVPTSANETISNSSLTATFSGAEIVKNKSETPKHDVTTSDIPTTSTPDVKEKRDVNETSSFLGGVTAREERLRKLKELLKEKQKAVDEIRQQKGML